MNANTAIGPGGRMVGGLTYMYYKLCRQSRSADRLAHIFPQADSFERQYLIELATKPTNPEAA